MNKPGISEKPYKSGGLHGDPTTPKPNIRPVAQNDPRDPNYNRSEDKQTRGIDIPTGNGKHCPCDEDDGYQELFEILTGRLGTDTEMEERAQKLQAWADGIEIPVDKIRSIGRVHVKVYKVSAVYDIEVAVPSEHPRDHEIKRARQVAVEMAILGQVPAKEPDIQFLTIAY